jgi:hypothetical protein
MKHVLLVPVLLLAGMSAAISLVAGRSLVAAERLEYVFSLPGVEPVLSVLYIGMLLLGLGSGAWRAFAAPTPDERRRLGIIIAEAAAGLLPALALACISSPRASPRRPPG